MRRLTTEGFTEKAKEKHGELYDYSRVNYVNAHTKIIIICPEHGSFGQKPNNHLNGSGCNKCGTLSAANKQAKTTEIFINECKLVHDDKYDYIKVDYVTARKKVIIICPEHDEFEQTPNNHLRGDGCPTCNESKGEREIRLWIKENIITYIPQHRFNDCRNKNPLPFDFYLPDYNVCIEYQGEQHFKAKDCFGGEDGFNKIQKHDKIKRVYCINNNIPLLEIKYNEDINEKLKDLLKH